jgi:hypothetical protein
MQERAFVRVAVQFTLAATAALLTSSYLLDQSLIEGAVLAVGCGIGATVGQRVADA